MLQSLGWDTKVHFRQQSLWEYAFGETSDGTSVSSITGKDIQNQIWRRLLNNLPYLLKHKGSSRVLKVTTFLLWYSIINVNNHGVRWSKKVADGGTTKFTFEDRTALNISGSQSVLLYRGKNIQKQVIILIQ